MQGMENIINAVDRMIDRIHNSVSNEETANILSEFVNEWDNLKYDYGKEYRRKMIYNRSSRYELIAQIARDKADDHAKAVEEALGEAVEEKVDELIEEAAKETAKEQADELAAEVLDKLQEEYC